MVLGSRLRVSRDPRFRAQGSERFKVQGPGFRIYRGTSLIRKCTPL